MTANKFKLPKQFPNVIKFLDRVSPNLPDRGASGKLLCVGGQLVLVTRTSVFILDGAWCSLGLHGVEYGDRFNVYIHVALEAMGELYPKHHKEIEAFDEWLATLRKKYDEDREKSELERLAAKYGYAPAGKRAKVVVTDSHVTKYLKVLNENGKVQVREAYRRALEAVINGK